MKFILMIMTSIACYVWLSALLPSISPRVRKAIRARGAAKTNKLDAFISKTAEKLIRLVEFDDIKLERLQSALGSIGSNIPADLYTAKAVVKGVIYSGVMLIFISVSPLMLLLAPVVAYSVYRGEIKKIDKQIKERRVAIERELPQFAGTIRQCLSSSRSIIVMLESYKKVCGLTLQKEIEKTLNDIKMSNEEKALKSLENRINSAKFSELTRGLIGVVRGEDQKLYFEMLTHEYIRAENENVRKELVERPLKLKPYTVSLLGCMALMYLVAIGLYAVQQYGAFK